MPRVIRDSSRRPPATQALLAVCLLAAAGGGLWALHAQATGQITQYAAIAGSQGSPEACCAVPGPYNRGRFEEAGPAEAPVQVIGYQGSCWEHKIAGDMLIALAAEYPDLLHVSLAPLESKEGEASGLPCTAYLLKAEGYRPAGRSESKDGFFVLVEKSPDKGGWDIADLEEYVRAAIAACGGATSAERITPRMPREPSGADPEGGM